APRHRQYRRCTRTSRSGLPRRQAAPYRTARTRLASRAPSALPVSEVQHGQERFLRNLDSTDLLHALLALLLLLEELSLPRDVASVALGEHVLALGLHGLARDHARADRRLDRDVEH